jgi:hypothetical protein
VSVSCLCPQVGRFFSVCCNVCASIYFHRRLPLTLPLTQCVFDPALSSESIN